MDKPHPSACRHLPSPFSEQNREGRITYFDFHKLIKWTNSFASANSECGSPSLFCSENGEGDVRRTEGEAAFPATSKLLAYALIASLFFTSCSQRQSTIIEPVAAKVKNQINVDADPGIEHAMAHEIDIFEFQYDSLKVNIQYKNEAEMLEDFRAGKADVLIMTRMLDTLEKETMISRDTLYVRELQVAYDAVALVVNRNFNDTTLTMEKLKWAFNPDNNDASSHLMVFDQQGSVVKFMLRKLGYKEKVSSHVSALQSPAEVIEYVKNDKNAIGFVPFNFLSDFRDSRVLRTYDSVKILSLRSKDEDGHDISVSANQVDIVTGQYPLRRNINTVMRYNYAPLDWQFVDFLYKQRGARIFMKDGIIPAHIPALDIEVNTDGYKAENK
jgi:phosphate transport system substrate-binding protein